MRITIEVKRAEQSFDLITMCQQNYLVIEFAGQEIRVPCDEEQLAAAISECVGQVSAPQARPAVPVGTTTAREFSFASADEEPEAEEMPVASPSVFVAPEYKPKGIEAVIKVPVVESSTLRPVSRKPVKEADDAGIAQG